MKDLAIKTTTGEGPAWAGIDGKWQLLYGSFPSQGVSIEWHDFATEGDVDWGRSFHDRSLEICFNFLGEGGWQAGRRKSGLAANQVGLYSGGQSNWKAWRRAGTSHRFITLELSPEYLQNLLIYSMDGVKRGVRHFLEQPDRAKPLLDVQPMGAALLGLRAQLVDPSVSPGARSLWYESKIMEILAQLCFEAQGSPELFCNRHKRLNRERVDQAKYLLQRDLANPPSLEMLAKEVNCSSFHLSRIFAVQTGMTIPRYLRTLRIGRACELFRQKSTTVTEVAFAVGYSSLSAFNQAFVEIAGCCPGLYPCKNSHKPCGFKRI